MNLNNVASGYHFGCSAIVRKLDLLPFKKQLSQALCHYSTSFSQNHLTNPHSNFQNVVLSSLLEILLQGKL